MKTIEFTATLIDEVFKVYINGILHLQLYYDKKNIIIQNWKMGDNWYRVQFVNKKGKVLTYKQVAILSGRPKAYRAVGNILNKNRSKLVPCHRVIRSDGTLGGYNSGPQAKRIRLMKEGIHGKMLI